MVAGKLERLCVCVYLCVSVGLAARGGEDRGGCAAAFPARGGPPLSFLRSSPARCSVDVHLRKLK